MRIQHFLYSALFLFCASALFAADPVKVSAEKEKEALAVLQSDAPAADKALACKKLTIDGSAAAVPELAKLLTNPQLHSWARIALEAIPGDEASAALRTAAGSLEGKLLIGVVNSLGNRRDAKAVEQLAKHLAAKDADVASAAAVALGLIGNDVATKTLRDALADSPKPVNSAIAEGLILCAEQRLNDKTAEAIEIYDQVRRAEVPKTRFLEATRGAILARKDEGIPLLLEQLRSPEKPLFQLALTTAREISGGAVDKALAEEVGKLNAERGALVITAMADRPKTVVVAAIVKAAAEGPKEVRIAAITALSRVGDDSSVTALLETALDKDTELADAAKATLADLQGEKVNSQIAAALPGATGKKLSLLLALVGQRRISATPALLKALDSNDVAVRTAALAALGETVDEKGLNVLITQVTAPKRAEDVVPAEKALLAASIRMPDREACATELVTAMDSAKSLETKIKLLEVVGAVGGKKALAAVGAAGKSTTPELQDASTKLLGEWTTDDAAPVLLDLAKIPGHKYHGRAIKGYIRIARQFILPDDVRNDMAQKAMDTAKASADKKLVLVVLQRYPNNTTFQMALNALKVPEIKDDALATVLSVAQSLQAKGVDVKDQLSKAGIEKTKVEIVKAEYGSDSGKKDVTAILQKRATDLPLITLPETTYNKSFGGDPAPGSDKKLKVQYKLNGKPGEATFVEGALILLPATK
ncbi:HEAT repeat domain-containing protein [Anatilimnocola floriformis]|uniref:HEAT repeat domain-containing protein n=1 Tax=Anatilimnocola floriformis TaxID=2948575 RepID=UPI0020C34F82|nr:HEAT repeat domain-containing protein [Anatilimnocola floriformis]